MALTPTVLFDAYISINANVISDHGNKVEVAATVVDLDSTAFGQTWMNRVGGLKDGKISIDLLNDFVAANLDSIMWALLGQVVPFEIRPTSAARAVGNPAWTGSILVNGWNPISGKIGELDSLSMSYPTSGVVTRVTA